MVKDFVQAVEALGYDCLHMPDMVIGANPERPGGIKGRYNYKSSHHEVFVLLGYVAGLTKSLELATGILVLPQRPTVLVAKQAAGIVEKLNGYLEEEERKPDEFGIDIRANLSKHPRDTWAKLVEQWWKMGVTYIGVNTMGSNFETLQERLGVIEDFRREAGL